MTTALFPDLRVVPLEQCVLHEQTDADRVTRLVGRLTSDRVLRNPPILGRHPDLQRLIVLDGATRVTALRILNAPHIVAQLVDYADDAIQLHTWSHLLSGTTLDDLYTALAGESRLSARFCDPTAAEQGPAYLVDRAGRCLAFDNDADIVMQAATLRQLFAAYTGRATITRVPPAEWRTRLDSGEATVAVVFPVHTKYDLVALARAGAVLPAGITRHLIPGRALRINLPLDLLLDERPLAEKQAWLDVWVRERRAGHGVRYYAEPTFLFDE